MVQRDGSPIWVGGEKRVLRDAWGETEPGEKTRFLSVGTTTELSRGKAWRPL